MRYIILFILIFSITISSCQIKKTIINISPNLGNPLTLDKNKIYCVDSYNKTKDEIIITKLLKHKLKVLEVQLGNDCKFKLMVEIIIDKSINSKNIPVSYAYEERINSRKGNESNYSKTVKEWNKFGTIAYKENNISVLLYIDVYDTNNVLINSVNSFSDKSKRKVIVPVSLYINGENRSHDRIDKYDFKKSGNPKYPIYSSVNQINMNHILGLDDKILKSNVESGKVELLKIKMGFRDQKNYKANKEDVLEKIFYTRRCNQTHGDNVEMMSIQQLYYFMAQNSFDKFTSINGIGTQAYHLWNSENNNINTVYFYSPACEEVTKVDGSGRTYTATACKWKPSSYSRTTSGVRSEAMPKQLYSQYFEPYKTYIYYWAQNPIIRHQNFDYIAGNVGENIFCASKEFKSPKLGAEIDLDDVQTSKAFTYIQINAE